MRAISSLLVTRLLEEGVKSVLEMVQAFRAGAGVLKSPAWMPASNAWKERPMRSASKWFSAFYQPGFPTVRGIALKDLIELNEKSRGPLP